MAIRNDQRELEAGWKDDYKSSADVTAFGSYLILCFFTSGSYFCKPDIISLVPHHLHLLTPYLYARAPRTEILPPQFIALEETHPSVFDMATLGSPPHRQRSASNSSLLSSIVNTIPAPLTNLFTSPRVEQRVFLEEDEVPLEEGSQSLSKEAPVGLRRVELRVGGMTVSGVTWLGPHQANTR